jgi:hypothetical protein
MIVQAVPGPEVATRATAAGDLGRWFPVQDRFAWSRWQASWNPDPLRLAPWGETTDERAQPHYDRALSPACPPSTDDWVGACGASRASWSLGAPELVVGR